MKEPKERRKKRTQNKQPQTYIYATENRLRKLDRKGTERKCQM